MKAEFTCSGSPLHADSILPLLNQIQSMKSISIHSWTASALTIRRFSCNPQNILYPCQVLWNLHFSLCNWIRYFNASFFINSVAKNSDVTSSTINPSSPCNEMPRRDVLNSMGTSLQFNRALTQSIMSTSSSFGIINPKG